TFKPPVVLNPDPRFAARDVAFVKTKGGLMLAALDARDSSLSFYTFGPGGGAFPRRTPGPAIPGLLPVRLAAADLTGNGRDDLVVATASNQVFVYLQNAAGGFNAVPDAQFDVGVNPSDIALVDVNGDNRPDVVVTDQFSGDVSVLLNQGGGRFSAAERFR